MKKPNTFILGAPKCGTTALFHYLKSHPQVFAPAIKEPHYFCTDLTGNRAVTSLDEYLGLFRAAEDRHLAVAEASAFYLFSENAAREILNFNEQARFIVMLRNPVDLAYSLHAQSIYKCIEDEPDFETAWRLKDVRAFGERIPRTCKEPKRLEYHNVARLGQQVERLLRAVPRERILFILNDEFHRDSKRIYDAVLDFLGLAPDGRVDFAPVNRNKEHGSSALAKFLRNPPPPLEFIKQKLREGAGLKHSNLVGGFLKRMARTKERPPLNPQFRRELEAYFRADVVRLAELVQRDLSAWSSKAA